MKERIKDLVFLIPAVLVVALAIVGFRGSVPTFSEVKFPDTVQAGNVEEETADPSEEQDSEESQEELDLAESDSSSWQDGVYQGSGTGFGGIITAQVTIENQQITQITITNHALETPEYYSRAAAIIPKMIQKQSANVDVVSGATYSSNGIKQAVSNALAKAAGESVQEVTDDAGQKDNSSQSGTKSKKQTSVKGTPADGTYTGSADCEVFGYTLSLSVKFKEEKAVSISNLKISNNDDPANEAYWQKAWKPMVKKILQKQSSDVDVVSGATYSSNAIVSAYLDAYGKAVAKNGGKKTSPKKKASKPASSPKKSPTVLEDEDQNQIPTPDQIQDGTYTVTAACDPDSKKAFQSYQMSADVTFAGGKLTSITNFTSTDESNRSYYLKAANGSTSVKGVVQQLIEKQSASGINAVSGATCSSKTIRNLYLLALAKAGASVADNSTEDMAVQTPAPKPTATPIPDTSSDSGSDDASAEIHDGTYSVSVIVWPDEWEEFVEYTLSADVTFADGKFVSMTNIVISDTSNWYYCDQAWNGYGSYVGIGQQLQDTERLQFDVVSGATCSSYAFVELYEKALIMAKQS